jgi:hypothetical protein
MKLEEVRAQAKRKLDQHQQLIKSWFDSSSASDRNFEVGNLVLKWDKPHEGKGEHTKFQNLWLGPFLIAEKLGPSPRRLRQQPTRHANIYICFFFFFRTHGFQYIYQCKK